VGRFAAGGDKGDGKTRGTVDRGEMRRKGAGVHLGGLAPAPLPFGVEKKKFALIF